MFKRLRSRAARAGSWVRKHPVRTFFVLGLAGFLSLNALAFSHAGALTHFDPASQAGAPALEELGVGDRARTLLQGPRLPRPRNTATPADHGVAFSTRVLDEATPRLELWQIDAETPQGVVLLCHGYGGSKSALVPSALEFRALGYTCLLLDFRGSGGSAGNETSLGIHEAEDLARAASLARSLPGGSNLIVFGNSMGAAAALRSVHLGRIQPQALILEAPFNRLLDTVRHRFELLGVPSFPSAELLLFWGSVRGGMNGFAHEPARYSRAVRCRTLVVHGTADARVSVSEVREVVAELGDRGQLVLLEGVGHEPYLAVAPHRWRSEVRSFLSPGH